VSPENQQENDWLRRKNRTKVKVGSSTFALPAGMHVSDSKPATVDVTDDAPNVDPAEVAAAGGADGGAHGPEQPVRGIDLNEAIRQGVGLRKMRKMGR
jgi:hypothetical protein